MGGKWRVIKFYFLNRSSSVNFFFRTTTIRPLFRVDQLSSSPKITGPRPPETHTPANQVGAADKTARAPHIFSKVREMLRPLVFTTLTVFMMGVAAAALNPFRGHYPWGEFFTARSGGHPKFPMQTCGARPVSWRPQRAARVVGGQVPPYGAVPWQIELRRGFEHRCGGAVIGRRLVLTAAHCWVEGLTAVAGAHGPPGELPEKYLPFTCNHQLSSKQSEIILKLLTLKY